ncbi:MAG: formylglycine-generating enzyme family protein [Candidatus Riflebacteria bacterium]|nr:formylglycine-generating enzyme family protein [Candidatus Riflebacteria bacterium]
MKNNSMKWLMFFCFWITMCPFCFSKELEREYISIDERYAIEMVRIPAGTFESSVSFLRKLPPEEVRLTKDFYIGAYEITQGQWLAIMKEWPIDEYLSDDFRAPQYELDGELYAAPATEIGIGDDYPVFSVLFDDVATFCNLLSVRNGLKPCYSWDENGYVVWDETADGFRLPTCAEWEYAAGCGTCKTRYYWGDEMDLRYAHSYMDIEPRTSPHLIRVGQKLPNNWGLYDMAGNVCEWCWDPNSGKRGDVLRDGVYIDPKGDKNTADMKFRALMDLYGGIHRGRVGWNRVDINFWEQGFRIARTVH